jgi:cyclase
MHSQSLRVIPRLDIKGPNLVRGIQFEGCRALGLASDFAQRYCENFADEILVQDTVASLLQRGPQFEELERIANDVNVPLTFVGGITDLESARKALRSGADKIGVNTAAIENAQLYSDLSRSLGAQSVVASIDTFFYQGKNCVWTNYGRVTTEVDTLDWARQAEDLGVGELFVNSIDRDGTGRGYDLELVHRVVSAVKIPVVAGCGAGNLDHLYQCAQTGVSAISIASMLHYKLVKPITSVTLNYHHNRLRRGEEIDSGNIEFIRDGYGGRQDLTVIPHSIGEIKNYLRSKGITLSRGVD